MAYNTDGVVGLSLGTSAVDDGISLNKEVTGTDGSKWLRIIAGSAIAQYDTVHIASSGTANPITAALAKTAGRIGFAQVAHASGATGWVQICGSGFRLNVGASCLSGVPLYTTDTAGTLDDATVSASQYLVMGVQIVATNSGSASNVAGVAASYPIVRIPLNV